MRLTRIDLTFYSQPSILVLRYGYQWERTIKTQQKHKKLKNRLSDYIGLNGLTVF